MAEIQPLLAPDLKINVTRDQSEFIETSLHSIEEHLIVGGLLADAVDRETIGAPPSGPAAGAWFCSSVDVDATDP